ncbi:MAG: WD40/YVTN/BNR-like repeat-containing protein [Bacteroidales bacterium]
MKKITVRIITGLLALMMIMPSAQAQRKRNNDEGAKDPLSSVSLSTFKFRGIGPALTSGRLSDLAVNPDDHSEFYVAASAGGVWKTSNGGLTFDPIFDDQGSFSIGCLAMDPSNHNVIWVGTGENNNQRSVSYGDGLYKSIDGGRSWEKVGLEESEHIGMIAIDPRNTDVVYVAAYGPVWSAGGDRGIYKTTDGGESWERILHVSEHTGFNEIHMDPRDPDVLYATAHQRRRRQWTYLGGGPESGIYKSTDAGKTWKEINKGLPSVDMGRIGMAISPANPEIMYAVVEAQRGQGGFYRSTNRGASWEKRSSTSTSGNYYQELIADPVDENRVYIMNTYTLLTTDGGKTFTTRGERSKHIDNHCLWINPDNPAHVMEGSDGGLYESFDYGDTWRFFTNLPVTQFYKVSVDNDFPFYNIMGGTQDNYSMVGPSQTLSDHGIVSSDWIVTVTGDGFESVADPEDPNIVYAQSQYGNLVRFDKKSGEGVRIVPQPGKGEKEYNFNWDSPLMISPHDHKTLYFAANKLFKSTDRGNSWEVISDDLDRNIDRNKWPVMGQVWPMDAVAKNGSTSRYGAVVSLDESRLREGLIYAGTDDGQISVTEDGGENWFKINSFPGVPEYTYVYDLIASKHNENVVFAAFNNHKSGDFTPYVYRSDDKGRTWTSISSNLPEGAVYALEQDHVDKDILFAGTEYGAFVSLDGGSNWKQLKAGVPTINVRDMAIQERENDLVLGTFGRGFYVLDNYAPMREIKAEIMDKPAHLFKVKDALLFNTWRPLGGLGSREKGFQGEDYYSAPNPERGAVFTYMVKEGITSLEQERKRREAEAFKEKKDIPYPTLEEYKAEQDELPSYLIFTISDEDGNFIREMRSPVRKGLNKIVWDLKYPSDMAVRSSQAQATSGLPSSSVFVLPGKYTVSLSQNIRGEISELAGPVEFKVLELENRSLPAGDRTAMRDFKLKALKLDNALRAASSALSDMNDRIDPWKAATKAFGGQQAAELMKEVREMENKLEKAQVALNGDRDYNRLDLDPVYSLSNRVRSAVYGVSGSTSEITGIAKKNYDIAAGEFAPVYEEIKALVKEFDAFDNRLDEMGAPTTPGRFPEWK